MSQFNQMFCGQITSLQVIRQNEVYFHISNLSVNNHQGHIALKEAADVLGTSTGSHKDNAINPLFHQHIDVELLLFHIAIGITKDHAVPLAKARVLYASCHLGEERVRAVRHHHPNGLGLLAAQAASYGAGLVVQLLHRFQNPSPQFLADKASFVDHMGNSSRRDSSPLSDVLNSSDSPIPPLANDSANGCATVCL